MPSNESKYLSDFYIIDKLEHINNISIREFGKMDFLTRCSYFCFYNNTTQKKYVKKFGKFFFNEDNFKFKVFLTYKHFVCVVKHNDTLEYFDSVANNDFYVDRLKKITKGKYNVIYNSKKLQTNNYSCGRYVILRCLMYFNSLDTFIDILDENMKEYKLKDYDEAVDFILHKYYGISFD